MFYLNSIFNSEQMKEVLLVLKSVEQPLSKIKTEIIDEIKKLLPHSTIEVINIQHGIMFNVTKPAIINIIVISDDASQTPFLTIKTNDKNIQHELNHWCHTNTDINSWYFL